MNSQMFKLDLEKAEEAEIKFPACVGSLKMQEFQKNVYFCFIDYTKAFDCVHFSRSGVLTLCNPTDCSRPGLPVYHQLSLLKFMSIEWVMPPNHLILCHPLLLPPSIFPSIRVFSNESVLHIKWPKYCSLY